MGYAAAKQIPLWKDLKQLSDAIETPTSHQAPKPAQYWNIKRNGVMSDCEPGDADCLPSVQSDQPQQNSPAVNSLYDWLSSGWGKRSNNPTVKVNNQFVWVECKVKILQKNNQLVIAIVLAYVS